ncbi:MAG TPA: 50S ribosomal protein L4 [Anaerolineae bacterium]|jgi:large subunit ribosomal protein L4
MQIAVLNSSGEQVGQIELREDIFGIEPNKSVMHQALLRQRANARQGTADTKTRGEVSGGGAKPWKQKGTGRARQGSTRAPHWKGGGVVFGPTPRSYTQKMPKKMRHLALKSALSAKVAEKQVRVVEKFEIGDKPQTRVMQELLEKWGVDSTAVILLPQADVVVSKSASNLEGIKALRASYLNVRDLIGYDYLVLSREGVQAIEKFFADN